MKRHWQEDKRGLVCLLIFSTILFLIAILTHGTCDEGDSIMHYLYARSVPAHPFNLLDHWAKPLYVLVSFPAAQFGFIGVKLQNTLLSCIALWFTYLSARRLHFKWALAVFPIALFFKAFPLVSLSGLTEPLHNLLLSIAIYLLLCDRYIWVAIVVSFLPFVRSEGLFIVVGFGLFFALKRQWGAIPLLALGHIVYSIAGYHRYHDLLWVFHNIPYAHADGHYGHGKWAYYGVMMPYIAGMVNTVLVTIGVVCGGISGVMMMYRRQWHSATIDILFLIGLFVLFFLMHTIFWTFGLFGSFGLIRVFIAITGVMILIIIYALDRIDALLSSYYKYATAAILVLVIVLSLSWSFAAWSPYRVNLVNDFELHADQLCDSDVAAYVHSTIRDYSSYTLFIDAPYIMEVMNADIYGPHAYYNNQIPATGYPPMSIAIWDDWYSNSEYKISLDFIRNHKEMREVKTFIRTNPWGGDRKVVLFVRD